MGRPSVQATTRTKRFLPGKSLGRPKILTHCLPNLSIMNSLIFMFTLCLNYANSFKE